MPLVSANARTAKQTISIDGKNEPVFAPLCSVFLHPLHFWIQNLAFFVHNMRPFRAPGVSWLGFLPCLARFYGQWVGGGRKV